MKKKIPVFLFNGFLDAGKTKLMKEILEDDEYYQNGNTLVIQMEEGINELDDSFKRLYGINVALCLEENDFTEDYVSSLIKQYKPKQIFIELNAFFTIDRLPLPKTCQIYQLVSLIDATTFEMYYNNMRQLFNNMLANSTIIIFNRCDGINNLGNFRRMVRAFNQQAQIGFENSEGNITTRLDEDLPYDINQDTIIVKEQDYPIWYLDVFDGFDKYKGKTIVFEGFIRDITRSTIVVGRRIMTCCEADIQFYGYEVITDEIVKMNSYVRITGEVTKCYSEIAQEEVMMIKAHKIETLEPRIEKYLTFN